MNEATSSLTRAGPASSRTRHFGESCKGTKARAMLAPKSMGISFARFSADGGQGAIHQLAEQHQIPYDALAVRGDSARRDSMRVVKARAKQGPKFAASWPFVGWKACSRCRPPSLRRDLVRRAGRLQPAFDCARLRASNPYNCDACMAQCQLSGRPIVESNDHCGSKAGLRFERMSGRCRPPS